MAKGEYNEGRQAFLDGKPQSACPYGTHKHEINFGSWERDWNYGWEDAERESDKKGGE